MPVDTEGNVIDFFGRKFWQTAGYQHDGEFKITDYAPVSLLQIHDELKYGPPDNTPSERKPHLVSSRLNLDRPGLGVHAPALDIDFPVVLVEYRQPDGQHRSIQTVAFEIPSGVRREDVELLATVMRDLHMIDGVRVEMNNGRTEIKLDFHPIVRVHLVPSTKWFHLYINKPLHWDEYELFLMTLAEARIISAYYCDFSIMRKQSFLRYPGITKQFLPSPSSEATEQLMVNGKIVNVSPMVAAFENRSPVSELSSNLNIHVPSRSL